MKFIWPTLILGLTLGLTLFFNNGTDKIPPLGKILNPFDGIWTQAENTQSFSNHTFQINGISKPVKVVYDERRVPIVNANNLKDAIFVQGYLVAKDRLWQMELSVRAAAGELSEILGTGNNNAILKKDKFQRNKGILISAEKDVLQWKKSPKDLALMQAYVDGVNAYIQQLKPKDYPVEYRLNNVSPRAWTLTHSALFAKNMAEVLAARQYDIQDTKIKNVLGDSMYHYLFPDWNPKQSPVIPKEHIWNFDQETSTTNDNSDITHSNYNDLDVIIPAGEEGIGSNNWAVNGTKSQSGYPILCNDPHLALTLPSVWYEIGFQLPNMKVHGVTLPGIPGVVVGFNEKAAWGTTNVGHDVLDFYEIKWVDETKKEYWLDEKRVKPKKIVEQIYLKNGEKVLDTVLYTHWGPILKPEHRNGDAAIDLAGQWIIHQDVPANDPISFVKMMSAESKEDFFEALKNYILPAQNFIFANTNNDIVLQSKGLYPIRKPQQGKFIMDGSKSENEWAGFIPSSEIPMTVNPERNFVASANQHSTDSIYPHYYIGHFDDFRGRYLNRKLENFPDSSITVRDMFRLQNDNYSIEAEEALPLLLNLIKDKNKTQTEKQIIKKLEEWKYTFDAQLEAPTYFNEWWKLFQTETWDEIRQIQPSRYPDSWKLIEMIENAPNHQFFDITDTEKIEKAQDIAFSTFKNAIKNIDSKNAKWVQQLNPSIQSLSRIDAFSVKGLKTGGYHNALNANKGSTGPSWRMIVALGETPTGYVVYPGGQSGNAGSPFYDNMIDKWDAGEYYKIELSTPEMPLYTDTFNPKQQ